MGFWSKLGKAKRGSATVTITTNKPLPPWDEAVPIAADLATIRQAAADVQTADQEYETALARYLVACDHRDAAVAKLANLTDASQVEVSRGVTVHMERQTRCQATVVSKTMRP